MTRHDPAKGGAGEQVGTCTDPTSRAHVERAVLACALVHPELLADAIDADAWRPALWLDTHRRQTAQAVLDLVKDNIIPSMVTVHQRLVEGGMADLAARDAVLLRGIGDAIDHRYSTLQFWLGDLTDMAERDALRKRIVALADQLDRPGGVRRVAAAFGEAS